MRSDHRGTRLPFFLLCTTALLAGCGRADSQGEDPSITRWGGDLLGAGSTVSVAENVTGDVIIAGGELTFSGVAGGDYLGAGGTQEIGGRVRGDVRAAGGEIRFTGVVAKNVTAAGREVEIAEGASIDGNAYLAGQQIRVNGTISGFLRVAGGTVVVNGTVDGSVEVRGGSLRIGPGARITGDLTYRIPAGNVVVDPAAQIGGTVTAHPVRRGPPVGLFHALMLIGFLVAGAAVVALFPRAAAAAETALRQRPWAALGLGVLWVILVPICIAIIALTGIGVPLALIILALYLISLYIARAVVAVLLGELVLRSWSRAGRGRLVVAFVVGGVILQLLGLIPVLGAVVAIVATLFGLGAIVVAWRGYREYASEYAG